MNRKDEHVASALRENVEHNDFDRIRIVHHSLAAIDSASVNLSTKIGAFKLEVPFYINAMTGGSENTGKINGALARVAKRTGLMMALGSMSAYLKDSSTAASFTIARKENPEGLILANLNLNHHLEDALKCMDLIQADGIQFHLNSPQELVMVEGDRKFSHWKKQLKELSALQDRLIVKEVGFGISHETMQALVDLGIRSVDVSGRGGTDFVRIEQERSEASLLPYLRGWGQSTVEALMENHDLMDSVDVIASGGIRHPLDMLKAFSLGAKACAVSGVILKKLMNDGEDACVEMIEQWKAELRLLMALVGAESIEACRRCDLIVE